VSKDGGFKKMNEQKTVEPYQSIVVPTPVLVRVEKKDKWGHVPGLDDSELADVDELERAVLQAEWGPVLELPVQGKQGGFRPDVDEDGFVFGAFASVDFERIKPGFSKVQYRAQKLREQLKNAILMFQIIRERLPKKPASLILKYLRMGILDLGSITDFDTWQLGTLYLRARSLRKQITELEETSWSRKQERANRFFARLG
jgi:hypothetical protein